MSRLVFLMFALVPAAALAQEAAAASPWASALGYLLQAAAVVLLALASLASKRLLARFGVKQSAELQAAIQNTVRTGVSAAEEWAARELKAGRVPDSREKFELVLGLVKAAWPKARENDVVQAIDAELARTPGLGATGKRAVGRFDEFEGMEG